MKPIRNEAGFTFGEVMLVTGLVAVIIYAMLTVVDFRSELLSQVRQSNKLNSVVIDNVTEAKTRDLAGFVGPGHCLVRRYDLSGLFVSETPLSLDDAACGTAALAIGEMEVVWKVRGPGDIKATFEPANFMKLPKYKASIIEIEIIGRTPSSGPGTRMQTLNATIFRK